MEIQEAIEVLRAEQEDAKSTIADCKPYPQEKQEQFVEATQMAIEALEMWKLKKPVKDEYGHDCCPTCGYAGIYKDEWGGRYIPHCENCGQAIDWEDIVNDSR